MLTAELLTVILILASENGAEEEEKHYPAGSPKGPDYCSSQHLYPCRYPEENNQHIFCNCDQYKCKTWYISDNVTRYREFCLKWHNHWRNVVAMNNESGLTGFGKHIPQAADMNALSWNYAMEDGARCSTKKCQYPLQHDDCHASSVFPSMHGGGQSLYITEARKGQDCKAHGLFVEGCDPNQMDEHEILAYIAIRMWYEEYRNVENESFFNIFYEETDLSEPLTGNMAQLLWGTTEEIGCAATEDNDRVIYFFGCNYWQGSAPGYPIFTIGPAASKCPANKPAGLMPEFKGLCGHSELPDAPPADFFISSTPILKASLIRICYLFLSGVCLAYNKSYLLQ